MITLVCGNWDLLPDEAREGMLFVTMGVDTQRDMFDKGLATASFYHKQHMGGSTMSHRVFTNSDHFLQGLRVYVKRLGAAVDPDWLKILFFSEEYPEGHAGTIDKDGNLSTAATGFFDQSEVALLELF